MQTPEEILAQLTNILDEMFEVDPADVVPDAHLVDDLDSDSIDAVDLLVRLKELTGLQVDPEQFKSVERVSDVVDVIATVQANQ